MDGRTWFDADSDSVSIIRMSRFHEAWRRSGVLGAQMKSNTREALFGFIGLAILAVVVFILVNQGGSDGNAQAPAETAPTSSDATQDGDAPTGIAVETASDAATSGEDERAEPTPTNTPNPDFHIVQEGETLTLIAALYGFTMDDIASKNGLEDPNAIFAGQRLTLPDPGETFRAPERGRQDDRGYVVKEGDTLFAIAQEFGVSLEALADANDITDQSKLFVGIRLTIPEKTVPTPAS